MSFLNTFFDKIFCVNLDKRTDRWQECQEIFNKHKLEVERIPAVYGMDLGFPLSDNIDKNGYVHPPHMNGINVGAIGCSVTHLFVAKYAKQLNLKNYLVLEDDVDFIDDLNPIFETISREIPNNWDLLYFGGNHFSGKPTQYSQHLYRLNWTVTSHSIAVNSKMYDSLIKKLAKISRPVDCNYAKLLKESNSFVTNPHLAWQRTGYSDVQTSVQGYDFLKNFYTSQS